MRGHHETERENNLRISYIGSTGSLMCRMGWLFCSYYENLQQETHQECETTRHAAGQALMITGGASRIKENFICEQVLF